MTAAEIVKGLEQLGHTGWTLYGDDYDNMTWTSDKSKPTIAAVAAAAKLWVDATAAAKKSAQKKLAALGLTAAEIAAL